MKEYKDENGPLLPNPSHLKLIAKNAMIGWRWESWKTHFLVVFFGTHIPVLSFPYLLLTNIRLCVCMVSVSR